MESRIEQALERHNRGYNCAQAVVCTYCDLFGVDENIAYRMSEGFGLGMGMQSICGALSGAIMLLGLKNSAGTSKPGTTKAETYRMTRELTHTFEAEASSVLCKDIKSPPIKLSCSGCIETAAAWVEANLLF